MRKGETPKRCRPRDRDRKGRSKPLAASMIGDGREGGVTVGETLNLQAGRPASTMTERADGEFRSRLACFFHVFGCDAFDPALLHHGRGLNRWALRCMFASRAGAANSRLRAQSDPALGCMQHWSLPQEHPT